MKMMSEHEGDLPKLVADIAVTLPKIALGTGFAYLKMKRKARKSAKLFEKGLVSSGLSPTIAHELALNYETDLSIRKMISSFGGNFPKWGRREEIEVPVQPNH
ncbi:MAG: hypothetical protein KJ672_01555 [Candidatus Thermoplasmatota archaeon]|nr:hypothetical protein [Candidatus Thermoplasmatota archaeon]